jgi:SAM-dependent methyltransferase
MTGLRPVSASASPAFRPASPARSEAYRSEAGRYDRRTDAFRQWRELLIQRLPVRRGDTVLDVGCGTGLCLPLLQHKIGPTGTIIGIDTSEQMLQVAADRVAAHGWDNVRLIAAPVATARIAATADAAVFCAVHDLMQCPATLGNVFDHLRPARRSPRPAANGRAYGCGRCGRGSPSSTHRSSPTSPASTDRGDSWPDTSPISTSGNWPSAPDTSPSDTPQAAEYPDRRTSGDPATRTPPVTGPDSARLDKHLHATLRQRCDAAISAYTRQRDPEHSHGRFKIM